MKTKLKTWISRTCSALPLHRNDAAADVARYKAEPYVMSADVYSVAPHTGRGGWSWYTGSAGWAYRLLTEELLGIKRRAATFSVHPQLPEEWPSVSIIYQHGRTRYQIDVARNGGEYRVALDGVPLADDNIPLTDDGQRHRVDITQP